MLARKAKASFGALLGTLWVLFWVLVRSSAQTCDAFGQAGVFSVFAASQVALRGGVVFGGVAGGQVGLSSLTVGVTNDVCGGGAYPTTGSEVSVISSVSTSLNSVSLRFGHLVSSGQIQQSSSSLQTGCNRYQNANTNSLLDFVTTTNLLQTNSYKLNQLSVKSVSMSKADQLFLSMSADGPLQVFTVDSVVLSSVRNVKLLGIVDSTATIVVNVLGTKLSLNNINMQELEKVNKQLIWNFPQATDIQLNQVTFYGTVVAPYATVQSNNSISTMYSPVYVNTLVGSFNVYNNKLETCSNFDLSSIPNPPATVSPSVSPSVSSSTSRSASTSQTAAPSQSAVSLSSIQLQPVVQSQWPGGFYFQFNMQRSDTSTGYLSFSISSTQESSSCSFVSMWQSDGQQPTQLQLPVSLNVLLREWDTNRDIGGGQVSGTCTFSNIRIVVTGFESLNP